MILKGLILSNFRNYSDKEFQLVDGVNVVSGKNATGKTNLLEAVYLISTGGSFKAKRTEEMIRFGEELSRIRAELADDKNVLNFEVLMTGGEISGQRTLKRKYFIDGASKRKKD
ncbi:AAA family ATPase, partial [Candidatus Collierbacteria bacterium]|nr:AAA family ATPase [Candidatus Collierbacteria bacterium]